MINRRQVIRQAAFVAAVVLLCGGVLLAQERRITDGPTRFFETNIRPHLVKHCYGCHSGKSGKIRGGLRLDTKLGTLRGGNSGPAVVPNTLDKSLLWSAINYEDFEMPPNRKLPANVIADFRNWIEMGAPDPRVGDSVEVRSTVSTADIEEGRKFWSFQPLKVETPVFTGSGAPQRESWPTSKIDLYILANQIENGLTPAGDAEPNAVLRRLSMDLVGLPPTPEAIVSFTRNWQRDRQKAVSDAADSLLKSKRFGERWGRHWLDVARYAESSGKEQNLTYPHAWRYRDYVIDSFNEDKPYNRFVQEQIAGDLLPVKTDEQWAENLVATGFLAIGTKTLVEQNQRQFRMDLIDEQIDATTRVFLGLSVACARCHDHKFDAIPQADYYALAGIFESTKTYYGTHRTQQNRNPGPLLHLPVDDNAEKNITPRQLAALEEQLVQKRRELRSVQQEVRKIRSSGSSPGGDAKSVIGKAIRMRKEVGILEIRVDSYNERGEAYSYCMATQAVDRPTNSTLLVRGDIDQPAKEVPRAFPQILSNRPTRIAHDSSGRLELARWMTRDCSPLVARVMVNRVWLHLFGEGLIRTPEDLGMSGEPPSHPRLLDYLAARFIENGWSVKKLIREIVSSRVYRIDSKYDAEKFLVDPENKYLWRHSPRRLDAEVIRDSILAVSGQLEVRRPRASLIAEVGPASVRNGILITTTGGDGPQMGRMNSQRDRFPQGGRRRQGRRFQQNGRRQGQRGEQNERLQRGGVNRQRAGNMRQAQAGTQRSAIEQNAESAHYRSVYLPVIRDYPPRALDLFDFAESSMVVGKRNSSNTPDQGLFFLNNPFVIEQCDAMAHRLINEKRQLRDQIARAFLLAYGRQATPKELSAAIKFMRGFDVGTRSGQFRDNADTDVLRRLSALCQSIIAAAEFRYSN
ncbi:MAG: hypothetical protein CMJ65_10665 [Planctomycetaceae bacterium]|nr:hypothetical protein [Planctomycetaceae bacterium]MDP7274530.1 PSD1 and planctomycete cytochrome C domain-containing protein [Planctomycetaceae bacterium]